MVKLNALRAKLLSPSILALCAFIVACAVPPAEPTLPKESETSGSPAATATRAATSEATASELATLTPTTAATSDLTTIETPAAVDLTIQETGVGNEFIHLIAGAGLDTFAVGDDLVVYSSTATGVEIPIALVRVIGRNPDTLSAQTILLDPQYAVKANLRVDGRSDRLALADAELQPAPFIPAAGYLLDAGNLYIMHGVDLAEDALLHPLDLLTSDAQIVDAFTNAAVQVRVSDIGVLGNTARVVLEAGEWPAAGTLFAVAAPPTPEPGGFPCQAQVVASSGSGTVGNIYFVPDDNSPRRSPVEVGTIVTVTQQSTDGLWYHIFQRTVELGWIPARYLSLLSDCPN